MPDFKTGEVDNEEGDEATVTAVVATDTTSARGEESEGEQEDKEDEDEVLVSATEAFDKAGIDALASTGGATVTVESRGLEVRGVILIVDIRCEAFCTTRCKEEEAL